MISTTTHTTTLWYGINPNANFCPKCGCSVNGNTFERVYTDGSFRCMCGWTGKDVDFLKNAIEAKKIGRKNKIIEIEKNEN